MHSLKSIIILLGAAALTAAQNSTTITVSTTSFGPSSVPVPTTDVAPEGYFNKTTIMVDKSYTLYCPEPTEIVEKDKTYTATEPTTLTITNCPCTLTKGRAPAPTHAPGHPFIPAIPTVHHNTAVTMVVESYTTWCPRPMEHVEKDKTYTVTKPTMLTITNCPCTVTTTSDEQPTAIPPPVVQPPPKQPPPAIPAPEVPPPAASPPAITAEAPPQEVVPSANPHPEVPSPEVAPSANPHSGVQSPEVAPSANPLPEVPSPEVAPSASPAPEVPSPEVAPSASPAPEVPSPEVAPSANPPPEIPSSKVSPTAEVPQSSIQTPEASPSAISSSAGSVHTTPVTETANSPESTSHSDAAGRTVGILAGTIVAMVTFFFTAIL